MPTIADDISKIRNTEPGDTIILTDEQTISQLIEEKYPNATDGLSLEVTRVRVVREENNICEWRIFGLEGYKIPLFFIAKIVDGEIDTRVYFAPDDFDQGLTKGDAVEKGNLWLFQEPDNPNNFVPADLLFTVDITQNTENGDVCYSQKCGTLHGELRERPEPTGIDQPQFCGVTEYVADTNIDNPELIIVEVGGIDDDGNMTEAGPSTYFWQGSSISSGDYKIVNR